MMSHLVALHAVGLDADQWQFCASLGDAQKVTFPGHGSEPMSPLISLPALADSVASAIPAGSTVVGLSLGGMVAQHLALRHPSQVESMVLICTKPAANSELMLERERSTRNLGMDALLDGTLTRWFTTNALGIDGHPGISYARDRIRGDDPSHIASYWRAMAEHDLRGALHRIAQPVTVVLGRDDMSMDVPAGESFAGAFPDGRLDVRPGPHLLCLERPDQTDEAIASHLDWVGDR